MSEKNIYFKEQVLASSEYFEQWLYSGDIKSFITDKGEPIKKSFYCELHDVFLDYHKSLEGNENDIVHNCIGCNLEEGARTIELFFYHNKNTDSKRYFLTLYSLLFYLQAERLAVIYKELGYKVPNKDKFDWSAFPVLQRINCWANFFKHPKSYMLLHHPMFFIEGEPHIPNLMINGIIDDSFIHKFYKSRENNGDLRIELENKDNYIVVFPNLLELTMDLCSEFEKIKTLILNNKKLVEKLAAYTSLKSPLSE
jgi:hypothetical protein